MEPTIDDYEDVADQSGALWELKIVNEDEKKARENKPLKDYGQITCSPL